MCILSKAKEELKRKEVVRVSKKEKQMSTQSGQCAWTLQNKRMRHRDANWATSNRRTSMVQTIVNSGCRDNTVPCSPYCTCIQYGSNDSKKNSDHHIHHGELRTTRRRQQSTRTTRQQCSNSQGMRGSKTVVEREAEGERKETRKFEEGSGEQS
jgi:hypothetical protein